MRPETNPVLAALAQARMRAAPIFAKWCELNGTSFCPAAPADVARFVSDCASLGIEQIWVSVQGIAKLHASLGLADPTLGGPVSAAISEVGRVVPPRSWPDRWKQRFALLPHDLQIFVASHEAQRERVLRRAQNEAAAARQKLAACQQSQTNTSQEARGNEAEPHPAT